jgi:uncharacterized protein (TIGR03067 family)
MKRFAIALGLFAGVAALGLADEKAAKELNGSYTVKSISKGGMDAPEEVIKSVKSFVIKDGGITLTIADMEQTAKFTVDPTKKPAHLDLTPTSGPNKDMLRKGIYKVEKGVLTIVFSEKGDRPADFDAKGEDIGKIVLEKKEEKK